MICSEVYSCRSEPCIKTACPAADYITRSLHVALYICSVNLKFCANAITVAPTPGPMRESMSSAEMSPADRIVTDPQTFKVSLPSI